MGELLDTSSNIEIVNRILVGQQLIEERVGSKNNESSNENKRRNAWIDLWDLRNESWLL
jgi:hypothetical protein